MAHEEKLTQTSRLVPVSPTFFWGNFEEPEEVAMLAKHQYACRILQRGSLRDGFFSGGGREWPWFRPRSLGELSSPTDGRPRELNGSADVWAIKNHGESLT